MDRLKNYIVLGIAVLLAATCTSNAVFAASGNKPPGDPPYGLHVEGDAKGIKLIGVLYVELSGLTDDGYYSSMNATIRLRQGSDIVAFTTEAIPGDYSLATEGLTQVVLMDALSEDVIDYFFPGENLSLVVKDVSDSRFIRAADGSFHVMMDVVLAAQ